ncbi:hypothetical protein Pint_08183 [Pistacia integerrima]|uniref:Uncharacterized protein n=1 Tax=Pistacia integerrima TaxID=434235 RepID=A0ACC0XTD2_9ROSI|nr:hypothetical protein Pint_08183 [Pistacia integerrima]
MVMEPSIKNIAIYLCFFFCVLSPAFAVKTCDVPAIINFGDSNSDTGGLSASLSLCTSPYGETFFRMPAGRYSDGRLIIDFTAESFGLPYLSTYLDSLGTNFTHGANFATAASTIRLPISMKPNGRSSPFYLYLQNDLGVAFFLNKSVKEVNASVPDIVKKFSANIKDIYNLGGRSFWIHNTGPIGCLPYILTYFSTPKDGAVCSNIYNEVAQHFNIKLKEAVVQLRKDFPSAGFTYVDVYSVKYSMFKEPRKYGFELPLVSCCGYGGKYRYNSGAECEETIVVNGTKIFVGSSGRLSVRVNYDGIHYTEAGARFVFHQISTGHFSDPPVPLKMACHTS